jgi:hypothetical protein
MLRIASLILPPHAVGPASTAVRGMALLLILLAVGWLLMRYVQMQSVRISQAWQDLAAGLEFSYKPARGPAFRRKGEEVEGVVDGVTVRLSRYGLSPGMDSAIYTRWSAELDPTPNFVLYVHGRHALARLASMLGYDDLEVGDAEFDRRWSTKSDEPGRIRQILTPEVRGKINQLRSAAVVINDTGVNVVWPGPILDGKELKNGLTALTAILAALRASAPKDKAEESEPPDPAPGPAESD